MENLNLLKYYAITKGYQVVSIHDNFKLMKVTGHYLLITVYVSHQDYEYIAKSKLYMLLAEYNNDSSTSTHNYIDFKIQL
jgi:negative regulator of genetic competence, sporulation and motility